MDDIFEDEPALPCGLDEPSRGDPPEPLPPVEFWG